MRDIMSRMIGADIRYTQLGYWMRQPPYGFRSVKIDTKNGKRIILKPDKSEAKYILEHRAELLLDLCNPLRKAAFFGAIFNKIPTYEQIDFRTHEKSSLPEVNELFRLRNAYESTFGDLTGNVRKRTLKPEPRYRV